MRRRQGWINKIKQGATGESSRAGLRLGNRQRVWLERGLEENRRIWQNEQGRFQRNF